MDVNVIYCRTALKDDNAVIGQERICRSFNKLKEISVDRIYIDNGFSGTSGKRPELGRLIDDLDKIKNITIAGISRLSRDLGYLTAFYDLCKSRDIAVYDATTGENVVNSLQNFIINNLN